MNTNFFIETSASAHSTANDIQSIDIDHIIHQAAMHAASSGLMQVQNPLKQAFAYNTAESLTMQRLQSQFNRVHNATKTYWVN